MTLRLWCFAAGKPDELFVGASGSASSLLFVRRSDTDLRAVDLVVAVFCGESTIDFALGDIRRLCAKEPVIILGSRDAGSSGNKGCIPHSLMDMACRTCLTDRGLAGICVMLSLSLG